jgi:hypothetical protein
MDPQAMVRFGTVAGTWRSARQRLSLMRRSMLSHALIVPAH